MTHYNEFGDQFGESLGDIGIVGDCDGGCFGGEHNLGAMRGSQMYAVQEYSKSRREKKERKKRTTLIKFFVFFFWKRDEEGEEEVQAPIILGKSKGKEMIVTITI